MSRSGVRGRHSLLSQLSPGDRRVNVWVFMFQLTRSCKEKGLSGGRERKGEKSDGGKTTVCVEGASIGVSLSRAVITSYLRFLHLETIDSAPQLPTRKKRVSSVRSLHAAGTRSRASTVTQAHFNCVLWAVGGVGNGQIQSRCARPGSGGL